MKRWSKRLAKMSDFSLGKAHFCSFREANLQKWFCGIRAFNKIGKLFIISPSLVRAERQNDSRLIAKKRRLFMRNNPMPPHHLSHESKLFKIFLYRNFMRALETEESLRKTLKAVQYLTNCYHFAIMRLIEWREVTVTLPQTSVRRRGVQGCCVMP